MPDKYFCDTNIWVYFYANSEQDKEKTLLSEKIIVSDKFLCISNQVLSEFSNVFIRKYKIDEEIIKEYIKNIIDNSEFSLIKENNIYLALDLKKKYDFSFYDALIVSSALLSDCTVLLSEDMHNGLMVEGKLKIVNPFAET